MNEVEAFLRQHNIEYTLHEHPAVYTVEEAEEICKDIPGLSSKNLFLKDKSSGEYLLAIIPAKKKMNFKNFSKAAGRKKITFGEKEAMMEKLGVEPGSVSPFGLIHDKENAIKVYLDKEVAEAEIVGFHPNVNTATLTMTQHMFQKFFTTISKDVQVVEV